MGDNKIKKLLVLILFVVGLFAKQYICTSQVVNMPLFGQQKIKGMMIAIVDIDKNKNELFVYYYKDDLLKRIGQSDLAKFVGKQRMNNGIADVYKSAKGNVYLFAEKGETAAYVETVNVEISAGSYAKYTIGYACILNEDAK